jgi:DNA-binding NarL/FixJ family response regulator
MIKLAIVDDDARITRFLKSELLEFPEIASVLTCHSGLTFVKELDAMAPSARPEVIIMDISMGLVDEGIRATRLIKSKYPDIEVIIFTISDEADRIFEAFQAGAISYLLKNEKPAYILRTIVDVKNGGSQMSPAIARKTIRLLAPQHPARFQEKLEKADALTQRELEILEKVSQGLTYDQIGDLLSISGHTVRKHMNHIFGKLQVNNKIEALRKAEGLR